MGDTAGDFEKLLLLAVLRLGDDAYGAATREMQEEVVRDLKGSPPKFVIWKSGTSFDTFSDVPNEQRHPVVATFLRQNYERVWERNQVEIWGRRG